MVELPQLPSLRVREFDEKAITNPLVGIAGFLRTGKSTLALRIAAHATRFTHVSSFADDVKKYARGMGWNGEKDEKGRRLLQLLGHECGRECIDPNIWVDRWATKSIEILRQGFITVADDVRYENEVAAVREAGGLLIKMVRPGFPAQRKYWLPWWRRARRAHSSEQELPDELFDMIFDNDGPLESIDWFGKFVADVLERRFPSATSRHRP